MLISRLSVERKFSQEEGEKSFIWLCKCTKLFSKRACSQARNRSRACLFHTTENITSQLFFHLPVLWENKTIVNRRFLNLHPLHISYSYPLVLRDQPPVPGRTNGGGERENLQYFSESSGKENEMRIHIIERRIGETGLFSILSIWLERSRKLH